MADTFPRRARFAIASETVLSRNDLTDGVKQTWLWLDLKAGRSGLAKASYSEIANARGCTIKSAARHVHRLLEVGLLAIERPASGHGRAWYLVVNDARRGDTNVHPERTQMSTLGAVEGTPVSSLLESSKEYEPESLPRTREGNGDAACFACGGEADGKPTFRGDPACREHEDF